MTIAPDQLRRIARHQRCLVRLPGCGGWPCCLAHFRLADTCGVGMKPNDLAACWSCDECHSLVDGRSHLDGWTREAIRLAHAEAVMRTLAALVPLLDISLIEETY